MSGQLFESINKLPFETAPWVVPDFIRFRVGTCSGLWRCNRDAYEILAIVNEVPGNGHLQDVFDWFEHAGRRDGFDLLVLEIWNDDFARHLVAKRGFILMGNMAIKHLTR